jgi:hypothetical protein
VREQDGEHLTYAGGLRIAAAVLDEIKKEWLPGRGGGDRPPPVPGASATPAP